ncbi:MAG: ABC transporter ATP-binding protein [Lachnospiraceae bacterium]|nr:ABC transporter ATP-binding protein [Lachnospiraceae bacterium]
MKEGTKALVVEGVSKFFGGVRAVDQVSLTLDTGMSTVMIGPNGAGKTTLFNLIAGVYPLDEGRITLFGEDISKASIQRRSELGLVRTYQTCNLFKELTVEENLYLSLKNSPWRASGGLLEPFLPWTWDKKRKERIWEICQVMQLEDLKDTLVLNMSHGQQRQLELGMAIISDPKIILFDEPMAGLSPTERVFIGELIRKLAREKIILVIEHDMDFALRITDRIAVLDHGRLIKVGTPQEIQSDQEVQKIYKLQG